MKRSLLDSGIQALLSLLRGFLERLSGKGRDLRTGQAYTEYTVLVLFGVLLGLGIIVVDSQVLPEQSRIIDRLYGYIFDYYASLANYLNLPLF